jgi:cephalosporin-C deacetylase-like acetyl esterase
MAARRVCLVLLTAAALVMIGGLAPADEPAAKPSLAETLAKLDPYVTSGEQRQQLRQMLGKQLRGRIEEANRASSRAWQDVDSKDDWQALCANCGLTEFAFPKEILQPKLHVSGSHQGDGYRIDNLLYQWHEGLWITANLYLPAEPRESMPGMLLSHSHHSPKEQGELQDMGMTWARAGCAVLVPDHLGHGERREHPFKSAADFDGQFAVGRQDYNFRYDTGMQLALSGSTLIKHFSADLMCGVSVLLAQKGVDPKRIILLGAVAGGGDPAAYTAAFESRIDCVVPFNFGGPQPETRYPLPDDAETWFNYAGGGSWESTRNIAGSAAEGSLPWVIVGSVAPRKVIHAHEFSWDRERDPVWKRYEKIWGFYDARDNLAFAHGGGTIRVNNAEATHCNNIGRVHRKLIHEAFRKWFGIDVTPEKEYSQRRDAAELRCWTDEWRQKLKPQPLHEVLAKEAGKDVVAIRRDLEEEETPVLRRLKLRATWDAHLIDEEAFTSRTPKEMTLGRGTVGDVSLRRALLTTDKGIDVPVLLLIPPGTQQDVHPVVVAVAFDGKAAFLKHRSGEIAKLLEKGVAVCLADLRGCGETGDSDRGQQSETTAYSSTELMLSGTMLGQRVQDLRAVVQWLRGHFRVDPKRIALWGDSFTPPLAADAAFKYPRRIDNRPPESDPMGSLVVLLTALADEDIRAVYAHGGIVSYLSVLESPFVQLPHDCVVPGVYSTGDLPELVATMSPRPLRLEGLVDGVNRIVTEDKLKATYARAIERYETDDASKKLSIQPERSSPAEWLIEQLK